MSSRIKIRILGVFAVFTVGFSFGKADAMALLGTDENGREVKVHDVKKYLKQNPYKPPAKKKTVATLAPKPTVVALDERAINRLIDQRIQSEKVKQKEFSINTFVAM